MYLHAGSPIQSGKIVGGFPVNITQVPWQAAFYKHGVQVCGGSIIGSRWILTAAHCISKNFNPRQHHVGVGSTDKFWGGQLNLIDSYIVHEKFDIDSVDYDYALLRLKEEIRFNEGVQTIQLPSVNDGYIEAGTLCLVSGWGITMNSSESNRYLRAVEVPIVDHDLCNEAYEGDITARMLCAGYFEEGGKDGEYSINSTKMQCILLNCFEPYLGSITACSGDSGGPMVTFNSSTKSPILVGIVSWGQGCAEPGSPGVYGRVAAARDWIHSHTGI